jgi:hypothetical protein
VEAGLHPIPDKPSGFSQAGIQERSSACTRHATRCSTRRQWLRST